MNLNEQLEAIYAADRTAREAERDLLARADEDLRDFLPKAVEEAFAIAESDEEEARLRLSRLADLCAQIPGAPTVNALLRILDAEDAAVRNEAGQALLDVAYDRFKEVATAIEGLLERGHQGPSMQELPFMLTHIFDPDPFPILVRFLEHKDAMVVAVAIEALASFGDPRAIKPIKKLTGDKREITLEELDDGPVSLGLLASDAIDHLSEAHPDA